MERALPIPPPSRARIPSGGKQAPQALGVQRARVVRRLHARLAPGLRARQSQQRPHRQRRRVALWQQRVSSDPYPVP